MTSQLPFSSIIIPCYNEERHISACLYSIMNGDYPKEKLEVLVIDGMSADKTRSIVKKYAKKYPCIKLIENPKRITPAALNTGIAHAKGDVIIRMDAHARYAANYTSKCIHYLLQYAADNVGGVIKTVPSKDTSTAKAICYALSTPLGAGKQTFRSGVSKPQWSDTVFGGCYKKEIFQKIGLFNEQLKRSQDIEFNIRLKKAGGKILLAPDIISYYYPPSTLKEFLLHNVRDGIWAVYPLKFTRTFFKLRHYAPLLFITLLLAVTSIMIFIPFFSLILGLIIFSYLLTIAIFSVSIARKENKWQYVIIQPLAFSMRHFGYGIGSLFGLFRLLLPASDSSTVKKI